ncbi:hypothetical protein Q8F55_009182 [Vanrija albida]|uniref:Uncharacterized protein n=1 Tax=Vanrija albida TaxID=181172 RepID=A0ABR3PSY6_9TREE
MATIPLGALLPPSADAAPSGALPLPGAVLGPLPPSSALHAALAAPTALLVTPPKSAFLAALEDEDEAYLRELAPLAQLEKVETRHVSSRESAQLLFSLLGPGSGGPEKVEKPALIVCFDLGALFGGAGDGTDENADPAASSAEGGEAGHGGNAADGASAASYLQLVAAALAAARALGAGLLVLEPGLSSLPVIAGKGDERSVAVADGLGWLFGPGAVARVRGEGEEYTLELGDDAVRLRRRRCAAGEYAHPPGVDAGGWQWEWV